MTGLTEEALQEDLKNQATRNLSMVVILDKVVEDKEIQLDDKEIKRKLTKPTREIGVDYPRTESEVLEMMLANVAPPGGQGSPSPISLEESLRRLA